MAKPIARRIPSDDCTKTVDGTEYAVHEGERVELVGGLTIAELRARQHLLELSPKVAALQGEDNAAQETIRLLEESYTKVLDSLARRLVAWNWTDDRGEPLPAPDGTSTPLEGLSPEELLYLLTATGGEAPAERKND